MPGRVSPHHSLVVRLLAASVLIAVCSVAATAWLAARTTSKAIRREQGQVLSDDATVYDTLLGYAATHADWTGVADVVTTLAGRTGRRITLTTHDRGRTLAGSDPAAGQLPVRESAVVDPLHVETALATDTPDDGIDPRVVGPYRLTAGQRARLNSIAATKVRCLQASGIPAADAHRPSGRPYIVFGGGDTTTAEGREMCKADDLDRPTATEAEAVRQLNGLAHDCLARQQLAKVSIVGLGRVVGPDTPQVRQCVDSARREQLAPYVAPAALLFVSSPSQDASDAGAFVPFSTGTARIAEVVALVLALTVSVTVLVGLRLVRPLRALTSAALHGSGERIHVPVTTRDEIGYLAAAFNDLSERRERLDAQRKAMVSDVAHELRTPLSNIRSWLEAAEDGLAVSDGAFVSSLLQEALQLQHIIDDLQDLAAADAGMLHLHPEPVDVRGLLDRVAAAHRAPADAAGVRLAVAVDGDPDLTADPVRLRQAVTNLVSNAVRYTGTGGTVTLSARREGPEVVVDVADTGGGLTPEELVRVFDRFWRAEGSRSRRTGGSGLGLAIVRKLMESHGGTVTATSAPGAGSVFTLRLPARPPAVPVGRDEAGQSR